jgi:hypothetical protein
MSDNNDYSLIRVAFYLWETLSNQENLKLTEINEPEIFKTIFERIFDQNKGQKR